MLSVHRLRLLVELSERGTISAVADALHFTASTVSHPLRALEAEVGVALLERSPQSVRLTPAGEALAAHGREILFELSAARNEARAVAELGNDSLTVATFPSAGAGVVAVAAATLQTEHDGIQVGILEAEPPEALERLRAGLVDLAVVYEYGYADAVRPAELSFAPLLEEPVLACLPPSAQVADGDAVDLASLRDRPFVAGRRGTACHAFTLAACRTAGFEPDIAYETDDVGLTCALVNGDLAVALMASSLLRGAPTPSRTAQVLALPGRRVLVASHAGRRPRSGRLGDARARRCGHARSPPECTIAGPRWWIGVGSSNSGGDRLLRRSDCSPQSLPARTPRVA